MVNKQQTEDDFALTEVRHFWLLSSLLKAHCRDGGPSSPKVLEICDDLKVMALHTNQPALRARCEVMIANCAQSAGLQVGASVCGS